MPSGLGLLGVEIMYVVAVVIFILHNNPKDENSQC
jgi:hypothetical protein